jgi:serine/threonine-protein kinase
MEKRHPLPSDEITAALSDATGRLSERPWAGLPTAAEADELLGRSLNDTYVIEAALGEGGMGRIYRARHTRIPQKLFAIKVLRPELARNAGVQARFQREAETAACISHPNVVGVYDVGRTADGWSYLVCEFLEGADLAAHLEQAHRLEVGEAVHIALQVCDALKAAHERSVVHRDLKPHNVFLLSEGTGGISRRPTVKVLDFGLSRFLDTSDAQLTRTGVIMGTPAYMAPEQARAERGDHRVDIYGVGTVLYAALTGRAPFKEDTLHATVLAVMTTEPERPRSLNPELPEALELVIQKAMAKDPKERFSTMAELRAALEPFEAPVAAPLAGPKPQNHRASRALLHTDDYELGTSRLRLLFFLLATVALSAVVLATAVSGLELFTGPVSVSRTELGLLLLAGFGTLLTPVVLLVARLRRTVWGNSVRVLELLESVRRPLLSAVAAYGLAAVGVRFCDDILSRFGVHPAFAPLPGSAWAGWSLVLPLVAALAATVSWMRVRWDTAQARRWTRHLLGAPLLACATLAAVALVGWGARWRAGSATATHNAVLAATPPAANAPASETPPSEAAAAEPSAASPPPEQPPTELGASRATDEELAAALAQGLDGLLPLSEKHPKDARVLKPLVLEFASRAAGLADAMDTAQRLFAVAPEEVTDADLRFLVKRAAQTPGQASKLGYELMTKHMGTTGPDLLYELWGNSKTKAEAERLLATQEVRAQSSPALRIAYDLRSASSCAARVPLLPRAAQLGDERSVAILSPLSTGSKTGCGRWRRSPCPAPCAKEAPQFLKVIQDISSRVGKSQKG